MYSRPIIFAFNATVFLSLSMSIHNRIKSFYYAFKGIGLLICTQPNARIHLFIAGATLIAGFICNISAAEWIAVTICIALVLSLEAVNTAFERLTDLVSPDYHPLAGKVKDVAAGAVLIAAIGAVVVGLIVFVPKILALLAG